MKPWVLIAVFVLSFLGSLIFQMPAQLVARFAGLDRSPLIYERITGTIWSVQASGLSLANQPLGNARFKLQPAALVSGKLGYRVELTGESLFARGQVTVGPGGQVRLADLVGQVDLHEMRRLDSRLRQSASRLDFTINALEMSRRGGCVEAVGQLRTDLLERVGKAWNWTGPVMAGPVACDGESLVVTLSDQGGPDRIAASASVAVPRNRYDIEARVVTGDEKIIPALRALEFQGDGDVFVYRMSNHAPQEAKLELQN